MSFDLILFGGTGDLTWRKLMPALFQAYRHGKLPAGGRILAVARDERSDDEYRAFIKERFADVEPSKRPNDEEFARFAEMLHYRRMDLSKPEHYAGLKQWVDARGADTVLPFLATSPHLFPPRRLRPVRRNRSDDRGDPRAQPRNDRCRRQEVRLRNFPGQQRKDGAEAA